MASVGAKIVKKVGPAAALVGLTGVGGLVGVTAGRVLQGGVEVGSTPDGAPLYVSTPAPGAAVARGGTIAGIPTKYILIGAGLLAVLLVVKR